MSTDPAPPTPQELILGCRFKVDVEGRKYLNSPRYRTTIEGKISAATGWATLFDATQYLTSYVEASTREMEWQDAIKITIFPKKP